MSSLVLIVDDDVDARAIYTEALSDRGFRVLSAVHGAEGVHLARRYRPDVILMDIRMPVMDGWAAIRYIKSDPYTSGIPICALSAYLAEEETQAHPERWGFDRMIQKPTDPREVVATVEHFLRFRSYTSPEVDPAVGG